MVHITIVAVGKSKLNYIVNVRGYI